MATKFVPSESSSELSQRFEALSGDVVLNPRTGTPLKPKWLKVEKAHGDALFGTKNALRQDRLFTVCEEAKCPNISECWNAGTATFMILGDTCTRACRFCHVKTGNPMGLLDPLEPIKTAEQVKRLSLDYVVITMVDRDDLPDGGAAHIAQTLKNIQDVNPKLVLEMLAGDFRGMTTSLEQVLFAGRGLDIFAHNLETVREKTPRVRDARASYDQSLLVLANAKKMRPQTYTKSGLMLGLGESFVQIEETMFDMRQAGVELLTIGQYLQPTPVHLSVKRFVHPEEFAHWESYARSLGFLGVASGPLVRSSYRAAHLFPGRMKETNPNSAEISE